MEILAKKNWVYTLYKKDNESYIFSVLCGRAGLYELNIVLNAKEKELYHSKGEIYLDELARDVSTNSEKWEERSVKIDD